MVTRIFGLTAADIVVVETVELNINKALDVVIPAVVAGTVEVVDTVVTPGLSVVEAKDVEETVIAVLVVDGIVLPVKSCAVPV